MMKKGAKVVQTRRKAILSVITERPGITTADLVSATGIENAKLVSNAMWQLLKSGNVLAERVTRDGRHMNAYYLPDQVDADSVARVKQKLVDAAEVIPLRGAKTAPNSVFDVPRAARRGKKRPTRRAPARPTTPAAPQTSEITTAVVLHGFACALTNDGSLVLLREGKVQFSLSDVEAATLQSYLVKRAAASMFASMA